MEDNDMRTKVFDENTLLLAVTELCRELGLLFHHCRDSRLCNATPVMPDLIIVSPDGNGLLFAELKGPAGKGGYVKQNQQRWKWAIIANMQGQSYRLWRPYDWGNETIQNELRSIA